MTIEPPIVMMVCVNDHEEVGWKGGLLSTCWVCGAVGKGPEFWDDSPEEQSR